jgi:hypothetical protein
MVINDTERLSNIIIDAARATNTRIIVQSSWSKIDVTSEPILCHGVGPVAHDWLLPQCCAVVHHGTYLIFTLRYVTLRYVIIVCVALRCDRSFVHFTFLCITHIHSHIILIDVSFTRSHTYKTC